MIVELVLNLIKSLVLFILNLFPTLPDLNFVNDGLQPFVAVVSTINSFVSVPLFFNCVVALIAFSNAEFLWVIVMWCVKKIPGLS